MQLSAEPESNVVVTVTKQSGDGDLSTSPSTLTFTPSDWATPKTVTVSAAQDVDTVDGTATFVVSSSGLTSQTVTATEEDDDPLLYMVIDANSTGGNGTHNGLTDVFLVTRSGDDFEIYVNVHRAKQFVRSVWQSSRSTARRTTTL